MAKIKKSSELLPTVETDFIDRSLDDILIPVYRDVPYTEIENRAQMLDPEKNLESWFGVDRKIIQEIVEVQGEYGPNGEKVFKPVNDDSERVRFVGNWNTECNDNGIFIHSYNTNDYIEIVSHGTGLNILIMDDADNLDIKWSIDGGAESSNIYSTAQSGVLAGDNYSANVVVNLNSNQAQGIHTYKLRNAHATETFRFHGYEIINQTSTIKTMEGSCYVDGKSITLAQSQTYAYDSGFDSEYGTDTGDGGVVINYLDSDGNFKREVRWADATPQYLTNTDHSNEEVIRNRYWREYGAAKTDDFHAFTGTDSDIAYVLDDNSSYLHANGIEASVSNIYPSSVGEWIVIGGFFTGLDVTRLANSAAAGDIHEIFVNGVSVGDLSGTVSTISEINKICSSLPVGFNVVRIEVKTNASTDISYNDFILYGPKTPSLPSGCFKLNSYYINADFVGNSTGGRDYISTGTIRRTCWREMRYVNGGTGTTDWQLSVNADGYLSGRLCQTNREDGYIEIPFYGTGFDLRYYSDTSSTSSATLSLNGQTLNTTNFPSISGNNLAYGDAGISFTESTGVLDTRLGAGNVVGGVYCSNLPLDNYVLKINNDAANEYLNFCSLDIIAPTYYPVDIGNYSLQNIREVGNCNLVNHIKVKEKVSISRTLLRASSSTTSTTFVPVRWMSTVINLDKERSVEIIVTSSSHNATNNYLASVFINSKDALMSEWIMDDSGDVNTGSFRIQRYLPKGRYHIYMVHAGVGGTSSAIYRGQIDCIVT